MTRPQTVPAALDEAEHLAVYNSRQQVGSVIERRTGRRRFIAFTPDGHRVGSYADMRTAVRALPPSNTDDPKNEPAQGMHPRGPEISSKGAPSLTTDRARTASRSA